MVAIRFPFSITATFFLSLGTFYPPSLVYLVFYSLAFWCLAFVPIFSQGVGAGI